jgi:hypothetical protein
LECFLVFFKKNNISGYRFSKSTFFSALQDAFYTRDQYQQLVFASLGDVITESFILLPPTIIKPRALWTGKQVVSTLLKNLTVGHHGLNLDSHAKINNFWAKGRFARSFKCLSGVCFVFVFFLGFFLSNFKSILSAQRWQGAGGRAQGSCSRR